MRSYDEYMTSRLSDAQQRWVDARLPDAEIVADLSWELVDSIVLRVRGCDGDVIVKAGGPRNHHILRELSAHPRHTAPLTDTGHAARLLDGDPDLRVMLLEYLPGVLVEKSVAERDPRTYERAGGLLRRLHDQESRLDAEHERKANGRALDWLHQPHRIAPETMQRVRQILENAPTRPVWTVPTHGDWQPRNWLIDGDVVRVIDFGRFAFRTTSTDLARLAAQQWRDDPSLEAAFLDGYGCDPREPEQWRLEKLREAVGTACYAVQLGESGFEEQGHRMLADALAAF